VRLVESMAWGDTIDGHVRELELALAVLLEATRDAYPLWEDEALERFGSDSACMVSPEQAAELPAEVRLAWIGDLVRTVAFGWGVPYPPYHDVRPGRDPDGGPLKPLEWADVDQLDRSSPARLIHGIDRLVPRVPGPSG
jgi:hypothetical protein